MAIQWTDNGSSIMYADYSQMYSNLNSLITTMTNNKGVSTAYSGTHTKSWTSSTTVWGNYHDTGCSNNTVAKCSSFSQSTISTDQTQNNPIYFMGTYIDKMDSVKNSTFCAAANYPNKATDYYSAYSADNNSNLTNYYSGKNTSQLSSPHNSGR